MFPSNPRRNTPDLLPNELNYIEKLFAHTPECPPTAIVHYDVSVFCLSSDVFVFARASQTVSCFKIPFVNA